LKLPALSTVLPLTYLLLSIVAIISSSGEERGRLFLSQRISVIMQRFNAILLHNRFRYKYGRQEISRREASEREKKTAQETF